MGLPRTSFLKCVPASLHVTAFDAEGVGHDAVMVSSALANDLTEYGITRRDYGDAVFTDAPFSIPENKLTVEKAGKRTTRRIRGSSSNPVLVQIDLGEDYD